MSDTQHLDRLEMLLQDLRRHDIVEYRVPGAWIGEATSRRFSSGSDYLLDRIAAIRNIEPNDRTTLVYNAMVRHVTSYVHSDPEYRCGWSNTGTFLKLLGIIPYLHALGVTQVILLPVFERGRVNSKGSLGSPYAVRDPFAFDQALAEPLVAMSASEQACAMIEAFHVAGIKVIFEFVLRITSVDSILIGEHPEWFYWIKESSLVQNTFASPQFSIDEQVVIESRVAGGDLMHLPSPDQKYISMFSQPPTEVFLDEAGWHGCNADDEILRIPHAFADWPLNDLQPAWTDVTYLKLHNHPDFLYPAYNTLRMYDAQLDKPHWTQIPLWNHLRQIIPHYLRKYRIDGVMLDMGHAIPRDLRMMIIQDAKNAGRGLIVYEECFERIDSDSLGNIDATVGYSAFVCRTHDELLAFTHQMSQNSKSSSFFGAVETHNTPRIHQFHSEATSHAIWRYLSLMPGSIPFVVAGFELGERCPINTGLGFDEDQARDWAESGLPLFDDVPLAWDKSHQGIRFLQNRHLEEASWSVRAKLSSDDQMHVLETYDKQCLVYVRKPQHANCGLIVVLNISDRDGQVVVPRDVIYDVAVSDNVVRSTDSLCIRMKPSVCLVLPVLFSPSFGRG